MQRGQPVEIGLHAIRQRLIGRVHIGEQRVAAARRALLDVEDRAHRRLDVAGDVGVPALAIGARRILVGIDLHQRRISPSLGAAGCTCRSPNLRPKARCCCRGDVLVAEEDHEVFGQRAMDLVHLAVGARIVGDELADIDAGNFRADDRRQFFDARWSRRVRTRRRCGDSGDPACRTASTSAFSQSFSIERHRNAGEPKRNTGDGWNVSGRGCWPSVGSRANRGTRDTADRCGRPGD